MTATGRAGTGDDEADRHTHQHGAWGIVNERTLYDALLAGCLFGAGIDVFETEPPPCDHPLLCLPNVVATPHAAGGTRETQAKSSLFTARQLLAVLNGEQPLSRVA